MALENCKPKKLYCFHMVLGYSRMRYIEFDTHMKTMALIRCHQNAFRYLHGSNQCDGEPEEILYDNMKQVVIKLLLKQEDSTLNRSLSTLLVSTASNQCLPPLPRPDQGQGGNIVFLGPPGIGKTHLARHGYGSGQSRYSTYYTYYFKGFKTSRRLLYLEMYRGYE